jgi:hypothetical protein
MGWELGMKTSLIGAYLLALGAGSALAADLPTVKAPPPVYPLVLKQTSRGRTFAAVATMPEFSRTA